MYLDPTNWVERANAFDIISTYIVSTYVSISLQNCKQKSILWVPMRKRMKMGAAW